VQAGPGGVTVADLGSTNGTFLNNAAVASAVLKDGDYLRVGNCIYRFLTGGNVEAEYHEEIYRLTIIDGLTDTHNKRYLLEFLDRELAFRLRDVIRAEELMARYGGEEFVAVLPETSAPVAQETAERLRRAVEDLAVNSPQGPVKVTISIGVATLGPATNTVTTLINAADRALYEAKQKGRNRVIVSN